LILEPNGVIGSLCPYPPLHQEFSKTERRENQLSMKGNSSRGDPISPMLFILAMDHLQKLLKRVTESEILSMIILRPSGIKVSLYINDAAIFAKPTKNDLSTLKEILVMFGRASGLRTNL
jgi:hypothetical protein